MIRIEPAIVVEGRYDKNKIKQLFDTVVLDTAGFGIFKDREKAAFIRRLARTKGILVLTDSDHAGFQIRNYIKNIAAGGKVYHAYTPDLYGKERRKSRPSREGKLGVEGVPDQVIIEAVRRSGVPMEEGASRQRSSMIKSDFLDWGLAGPGSAARRKKLLAALELPEDMTANALLEAVNVLCSRWEVQQLCQTLQAEGDKKP